MPLIRLARDKRGIDTLYLLHQRADERGAPRLRVLYFCAAPQGLAFGRSWLDADTQRVLERQYPDVEFDWPALLRELEQRRLPPAAEPTLRRPRPAGKTERRPPTSEVAVNKPVAAKRKRRRGAPATAATASSPPGDAAATGEPSSSIAAPIIEP